MNKKRKRSDRMFVFGVWVCLLGSAFFAEDIMKIENVASQPCWVMENDVVELAVTRLGAHMAPVTFCRNGDSPVRPYYISPWQDERLELDPPVLVPLRGDFFCLPFGGNAEPYNDQRYPPHGEPPGVRWTCLGAERKGAVETLTLELQTMMPSGKITKTIRLVDHHNAVYSQERLEGYSTMVSIGHHAILAVPDTEGTMRVTTSKIRFGMTAPVLFSNPANREYQSFAIGRKFHDLRRVPLLWKDAKAADCTRFPARKGYADLLAVFSEKADRLERNLAWVTATHPEGGYLWFSLHDPRILPTTLFWIENHGRHGVPWNGRNSCLGLEDVCSYLNEGMPISARPNAINRKGIPTALELSPDRPTDVNYIQGIAKIPADFHMVKEVRFGDGTVTFVSTSGTKVTVSINYEFVRTGQL